MLNIQRSMRDRRLCDAIGIYRSARDLWPDGNFGKSDITPDVELDEIREIFFANLSEIAKEYQIEYKKVYGSTESIDEIGGSVSDNENNLPGEKYNELDEDNDENSGYVIMECQFNFDEFISNFAKYEVIAWYFSRLDIKKYSGTFIF